MRALLVLAGAAVLSGCGPKVMCTTSALSVNDLCSDGGAMAAGQSLTIQLREQCGSACGMNTMFTCTASVDGGVVTFAPTISECSDPMAGCIAVCRISAVDCTVPALAAGTYTLSAPGLSKQLVVSADAGATRCAF